MANRRSTGLISDIQRYSIHDGPGVRTLVFFKGCPLNCWWCSNPECQPYSLSLLQSKTDCIQCRKCIQICPKNAIRWEDEKGIVIDRQNCDLCGQCAERCYAGGLKLSGRRYTEQSLLAEIVKDEAFYRMSGGGVTFSGGEPLFQFEFLKSMIRLCREKGLHTAIETSGYSTGDNAHEIFELVDLVLIDLKHLNNEKHKKMTGVSNTPILENWRWLRKKKEVIGRIPVIPGFNDSKEEMTAMAEFLTHSSCREIHLLPYHRYGEGKYCSLGITYKMNGSLLLKDSKINELSEIFVSRNLKVQIGA